METTEKKLLNCPQNDRVNNRRSCNERKSNNQHSCDVLAQNRTNVNSSDKLQFKDKDNDVEKETKKQDTKFTWRPGNLWKLTENESFAQLKDIEKTVDFLIDRHNKYADEEQKNIADELWKQEEIAGFKFLETIESSVDYLLDSTHEQTKPIFDFHGRWSDMILQSPIDAGTEIPATKPPALKIQNHEDEVQFQTIKKGENRNFLVIDIDGEKYRALFDSGAQVSLIVSSKFHEKYKQQLYPTNMCIEGLYNKRRKAKGELDIEIEIDGHVAVITFLLCKNCVVGETEEMLFGMDFIDEFDYEAKLSKGYWRVHEGKWHRFSKKSSDNEVHLQGKSLWPSRHCNSIKNT